tara:strand:+ start:1333 stop:3903 length:2571 start_codon:yes stop_codon:yes gene_type:complete
VKKFEQGNLYTPSGYSQGFDPQQVPDITPLLRENEGRRREDRANQIAQANRQREVDETNLAYVNNFNTKQAEQLSMLSETFGKAVKKGEEIFIQKQEEYGLMQAYTDGIPEEVTAAYNNQEAADKVLDAEAKRVAGQAQADGAPTDVSKTLRGMSIWAKRGFIKGQAAQIGASYSLFREQIAEGVEIDIPGREEPLTLRNASDAAEYAMVQAEIDSRFMAQLKGIPVSVLNDAVFPQMKAVKAREAVKFGDKLKKDYELQKTIEFESEIADAVEGKNLPKIMEIIKRFSYDFGGNVAVTRAKFFDYLEKLVEAKKTTGDFIDRLTNPDNPNAFRFLGFDGKEQVFAQLYKGELVSRNFSYLQYKAEKQIVLEEEFENEQIVRNLDKQNIASLEGGLPSEMELNEMRAQYPADLVHKSEFLKHIDSQQSRDADTDYLLIKQIIRKEGGISRSRLNNFALEAATQAQNAFPDRIVEDGEDLVIPGKGEFEKDVAAVAAEIKKEQGMQTVSYDTRVFAQNMMEDFQRRYAEAVTIKGARPSKELADQIFQQVLAKAESKDASGVPNSTYLQRKKFTPEYKTYNVQSTVVANNGRIDLLIPALVDDTEQLRDWSPGKGPLPSVWRQTAQYITLPNGRHPSAWQLANAQYQITTGQSLEKPRSELLLSTLTPEDRELLNYRSSPGRYARVAINSGWRPFLDLVASKESSAHGYYNAYNLAGSNHGHTAHGSGDSSKDGRFGKPLVDLTVGDVLKLGAEEKIHAAGRYQFVHKTLKEVVGQMGLSLDTPFNEATQDALAIHRALWRVRNGGKNVYNFGLEWVGLQDPSVRARLQKVLMTLPTASPYHNVDTLHPTLLEKMSK